MILEAANGLGPWAWFILGLILLGAEILVAGSFLLWFGIAAIVVGANALLISWSWQIELVAFAVLSIVFLLVGRRLVAARGKEQDGPIINERARALVGRTVVLDEPIVSGAGRVRIDDTVWRITGPDLPAGTRVRIAGADGTRLGVEPAPE